MKEKIRNFAREIGIEKCGFAKYDGKTAIVCLFPYFNGYEDGNISLYARSLDYHIIVREKLNEIISFIKALSPDTDATCFSDIGPSIDRILCYLSGLCFFGKNHMAINDDYGSFFFIGYILCDLPIEADTPLNKECMGCNSCIKSCPGGALNDGFCLEKCASHISQKKGALEEGEKLVLKKTGLIFGCDICQRVCPHNKITPKPMKEFLSSPIHYIRLSDIETLSNRAFLEKYKNRAFSWRGRKVLVRNLHILDNTEAE